MELITPAQARERGLTTYYTGKPCKHGHVDERLTVNGTCCTCNRLNVAKWQAKNPDKVRKAHERWAERNPGVANERRKQWYKENLDRHNEQMRKYYEAHPHLRARLSAIQRAAQNKRTPGWLTEDDFWLMDEIYRLAQLRTAVTGIEWHVDHIIPLRGKNVSGLHVPSNLRVIPKQLNLKKGNRYAVS